MQQTFPIIAGPILQDGRCLFRVWAPTKKAMTLHIVSPQEALIQMDRTADGYFQAELPEADAPAQYFYRPEGQEDFPDPASHSQPAGVHGASAVVDHNAFQWTDEAWQVPPLHELIIYELHVGTFTEQGTFEAIIPRLDDLVDTGINAIEIMPVAQFPGERNWGYDGVFPYAVQHSYGGPDGLKRLIDACHQKGVAVILDVVYNHVGPEGNYFDRFGPYFTDAYRTPWGSALNFDGPWSDGVREFFAGNALYWVHHFHIDGLRLDAIHAIPDNGAVHVLQYINEQVDEYSQHSGKPIYMIAESDLNAPRVIQTFKTGGYGFDAQWLDDFHHALFVLLYPEGKERYEDFGSLEQLTKAYMEGFVHSGEYVKARKRKYGASSAGIPGFKFVAFIQNHDQVGNHKNGLRLSGMVSMAHQRIAAAALLLAPYVPMLFMGEEYGEDNPFLYFTSHTDLELAQMVREGRKKEFEHFLDGEEPPDPQSKSTFRASVIEWYKRGWGSHQQLLGWYRALIALRRSNPALHNFNKLGTLAEGISPDAWSLLRSDESGHSQLLALFNLSDQELPYSLPPNTTWVCLLDSTVVDSTETSVIDPKAFVIPPISALVFGSQDNR